MIVKNPPPITFWKGEDKEFFITYKIDGAAVLVTQAEFRIKPESGDEIIYNSNSSSVVTINSSTKKIRVFLSKTDIEAFAWRRGTFAVMVTEQSGRALRLLFGGTKVVSRYENP